MYNFIIRILACFIPNQQKRRNFRNKYWCRYRNKLQKNTSVKQKNIRIKGYNNNIYVDGKKWDVDNDIQGLEIDIRGDNNIIELFTPHNFIRTYIEIGNSDCHIKIGKNPTIGDAYIRLVWGQGQHLFIGDNFSFWGSEIICDENSGITIGNDCLFSSHITIRPSDGHSVIDYATKQVINYCNTNMTIGDRCWIGTRVILTKNTGLANDTIVAAGAVVTKSFSEEKVVIAGNPAKIVKRGVFHHRCPPVWYNSQKK